MILKIKNKILSPTFLNILLFSMNFVILQNFRLWLQFSQILCSKEINF